MHPRKRLRRTTVALLVCSACLWPILLSSQEDNEHNSYERQGSSMKPLLPPDAHERLVDLIWQIADPEGYMRMQDDAMQRKLPKSARNDSTGPFYPIVEDRLLTNSPGVVDAIIQRTNEFDKQVRRGPATGAELDQEVMDQLRHNLRNSIRKKSSI